MNSLHYRFKEELTAGKTRGRVSTIMRSFLGLIKDKGAAELEAAGVNCKAVVSNVPGVLARLKRFEQGTANAAMAYKTYKPSGSPGGSTPTRGRGRPPGSGGSRTIVIDNKSASAIKNRLANLNTSTMVIKPGQSQSGKPPKRLSPGALEQLKKGFQDLLAGVTRVIRVDIVRYILVQEKQKRGLLSRVGIKFTEERSEPLCFGGMDPVVLEKAMQMTGNLVDVQWAVLMAETIFKLVNSKDVLSLETIGVEIDPTNAKAPLHYRLEHEARTFFSRYPNGENLAAHLCSKMDLQLGRAHVRAVASLLRCKPDVAETFIREGRGAAATAAKTTPMKKKKGYVYIEEPAYTDDIEMMPLAAVKAASQQKLLTPGRGRGRGRPRGGGRGGGRGKSNVLTPAILKRPKVPKKRNTPGRSK